MFSKGLVKLKHIYFTSIEKQVHTTYNNLSRFCFLGTTPVLAPNVWANEKNPKVDICSWESNSGPKDCKADAPPHNHGHHKRLVLQTCKNQGLFGKGLMLISVFQASSLSSLNFEFTCTLTQTLFLLI